jgi:hypothetical protein
MPCAVDQSVITIDSSTAVAIDTINHEGLLEDQGRNPNELRRSWRTEAAILARDRGWATPDTAQAVPSRLTSR